MSETVEMKPASEEDVREALYDVVDEGEDLALAPGKLPDRRLHGGRLGDGGRHRKSLTMLLAPLS